MHAHAPASRSLLALVAFFVLAAPADAGLIVTIGNATAAPNTTGNTLEVTLTNTGPAPVSVGGFSFSVTTPSPLVTFTQATVNTTQPYIFAGSSLFGPDITFAAGAVLSASDAHDINAVVIPANTTVGLGHVLFDLGAARYGDIPVSLLAFPSTSLSDGLANDIPITTLVDGTIFVRVPEPSSFFLLALLAPVAVRAARRRVCSASAA